MNRKRLALVPTGIIAFVLALASVAYACTTVGGTAEITDVQRPGGLPPICAGSAANDCAAPGDLLTVEASGGVHAIDGQGNAIKYYLYFEHYEYLDDAMACMYKGTEAGLSTPMLVGGPKEAVYNGSQWVIPPTTGRVPAAAPTDQTENTSMPEDGYGHDNLGRALVCFMGSGAGSGTVNQTIGTVTTRVGKWWGTAPDRLRVVAI